MCIGQQETNMASIVRNEARIVASLQWKNLTESLSVCGSSVGLLKWELKDLVTGKTRIYTNKLYDSEFSSLAVP